MPIKATGIGLMATALPSAMDIAIPHKLVTAKLLQHKNNFNIHM